MKSILLLCLSLLFLAACNKSNDPAPTGQWSNSVFIVNEGPFQNGSGTIMAMDRATGQVSSDLFEAANGRPLGNIVQSMAVHKDKAWIVVNNSNKVEVVNLEDFKSIWTLDIYMPRYVIFKGDSAFISSWNNMIYVYYTENGARLSEFGTWHGPDEMVIAGDYIFSVCGGGWGNENKVTYNNIYNRFSLWDITVADRPSGIVKDKYGNLWVLCSGNGFNGFPGMNDSNGALYCIDPGTKEIISHFDFPSSELHPDQIIINENGLDLYYALPDGIYTLSVDDPELATSPFIPSATMFYGLGYDQVSEMLYAADPLDYAQNGYIYRFNSSDGTAVDTLMAGVAPNGFCFNE
jgi:hypothetical protein